MSFDPQNEFQEQFERYGPSPLPDPRDRDIESFLERVISIGPAEVAEASDSVTVAGGQVLCAYAERMASLAVRQGSLSLLQHALVALVIGGLGKDAREAIMIMPLVENSVKRLKGDLVGLFETVAMLVGAPGSTSLSVWLSRSPEDRTLASMGFVESEDEGGFRYHLNW